MSTPFNSFRKTLSKFSNNGIIILKTFYFINNHLVVHPYSDFNKSCCNAFVRFK